MGKEQRNQKKKNKKTHQSKKKNKLAAISSSEIRGNQRTTISTTAAPSSTSKQQQSVYKRETIYPLATPWYNGPTNRFITPSDEDYQRIVSTSYSGYALETKESFPNDFHDSFLNSLNSLDVKGIFQYDITQPGGLGTKTAKTFVTRCLVGDPGTTYKYLGLRMFSIPWSVSNGDDILPEARSIYELNQELIAHTGRLLEERNKPVRGHQYNLTLINRCYPESEVKLKVEPCFGQEKCTVSWHADSSLEHFSSIGVYHVTTALNNEIINDHKQKQKKKLTSPPPPSSSSSSLQSSPCGTDWRIALRVWPDAEGPTAGKSSKNTNLNKLRAVPPVAISLPNQCAYYLLDDFNHHHQHSVLAGSTHRYASTHRVARKEGHSYQWLQARCQAILQQMSIKTQFSSKQIRIEQQMLQEIEFEWVNQFFIQGRKYQEIHSWWSEPLRQLVEYWIELNKRTLSTLTILQCGAVSSNWKSDFTDLENKEKKKMIKLRKKLEAIEIESYDAIIQSLQEIQTKREGWRQRAVDPIFQTVPENCRPIQSPLEEEYSRQILRNVNIENEHKASFGQFQFVDGGSEGLLNLVENVMRWKNEYFEIRKN